MRQIRIKNVIRILLLVLGLTIAIATNEAHSGTLQISWTDNSTNEDGFKIERKTGTTGTYAQVATVGANITSYTDSSLVAGATYCYQVRAYNAVENSLYSPQACGTVASVQTFSLATTKAGSGTGTITSTDGGINCGSTCAKVYNGGTSVTLNATPAAGSIFAGWSGTGCSSNGSVTMDANKTCTATFNLQPVTTFTLTVTKSGTGTGTVTSTDGSINCGSTCAKVYNSGTSVTLNATPAAGSIFAGWSGTGCSSNGSVTMDANKTCTATFNLQPVTTFTLTVTKSGTGTGTVTSTDGSINCGSTCAKVYNSGTSVTLNATPAAGSIFAGWSGTGCSSNGSVTMDANKTCTATFNLQPVTTFTLTVTKSGTGTGTVTSTDGSINCGSTCAKVYNSGTSVTLNATPAAGSIFAGWSGCCFSKSATFTINLTANTTITANFLPQTTPGVTSDIEQRTRIGFYRPSTGQWFLDRNGNGIIDDCTIDICVSDYGQDGMLPVVGDWVVKGKTNIGTFDPATGSWRLDHGSFTWDACGTGVTCISSFGQTRDLPVVREANTSDQIMIGIYRPQISTSKRRSNTKPSRWKFDANGDAKLGDCTTDSCFDFGVSGDLPVVGDWDGAGTYKIGVFRPSLGQWFLDRNGNGKWDGSPKDAVLGPFGSLGDLPVVGDWDGSGKTKIGVFRPSTGEWFIDINGNGSFDGCQVDVCHLFGQPGDLPVVGKW